LNDLWSYEPFNDQWTWKSGSNLISQPGTYGTRGVPSTSNMPGARSDSISWIDSSGTFWLFGGSGYDSTNTTGRIFEHLFFRVSNKNYCFRSAK